jgi:ABC-type polysaccharide/polyol phosphate export permease
LNWSKWIRQFHRWMSIAFTVTVIANIVALSTSEDQPADWITYSPLLPLAFLLLTGLYLFVLPYLGRRRGASGAGA